VLPDRITPRWMQPWTDLSRLAPLLPSPFRTAGWDRATYFMDDQGALHAFAGAPRLKLRQPDGSILILAAVPSFENMGFLDSGTPDRAKGWFNPVLANRDKVRIAIVADGRILAWATPEKRPDVAASYNRGELVDSGFTAVLPRQAPRADLRAVAVIDNRIGVVLR
jgi:hypothetical protein